MNIEPVAYINVEERKLEWAGPVEWGTPTIAKMDKVPLYTHQYGDLTDEEIKDVYFNVFNWNFSESVSSPFLDFARAILRKAQEK